MKQRTRGPEDQRTSGHRGPVGTGDQWAQRTRGTVRSEDQRKSGNRGHEDKARRHPKLLKSYGYVYLSYFYKVANHFPTLNLVFLYCQNVI